MEDVGDAMEDMKATKECNVNSKTGVSCALRLPFPPVKLTVNVEDVNAIPGRGSRPSASELRSSLATSKSSSR